MMKKKYVNIFIFYLHVFKGRKVHLLLLQIFPSLKCKDFLKDILVTNNS